MQSTKLFGKKTVRHAMALPKSYAVIFSSEGQKVEGRTTTKIRGREVYALVLQTFQTNFM